MIDNHMKDLFTETYNENKWAMEINESKSGDGSALIYTEHFRKSLVEILEKHQIKLVFDCSCGDWNWMKEIKDKLPKYIGNDIVEELIIENNRKFGNEKIIFVCNDMLSELKKYGDDELDLTLCRHTLEHLPTEYSLEVISEIKRTSKYGIITSNNGVKENGEINMDGVTGRGVNLDYEPYKTIFGDPISRFFDSKGTPTHISCYGYLYKF